MLGYKLFRERRDGSLGPLFINRRQKIQRGVWYKAESHPTPGYALRPGWHVCAKPEAPHLSKRGRRWFVVEIKDYVPHVRPESQGGLWYTAKRMRVVGPADV